MEHPSSRPSASGRTALAVGLIVLGLLAISAAFAATLATVLLFAVLLLVAGVGQVARALRPGGGAGAWDLLTGLVYLVAGGLMVIDPVGGAIGLTLLVAIFFFIVGVSRLAVAMRWQAAGSGILMFTGILDLVLGLLIVAGWPDTGAWVIGLFLGIELLMAGLALLAGGAPVAVMAPPVSPRQAGPAGSESSSD